MTSAKRLDAIAAHHRPDDWTELPMAAGTAFVLCWLWHTFRLATTERTCCAACGGELESK